MIVDQGTLTSDAHFMISDHDPSAIEILYNRKLNGTLLPENITVSSVFKDDGMYFVNVRALRLFLTDDRVLSNRTSSLDNTGDFYAWMRKNGGGVPSEAIRNQRGFPPRCKQVLPVKKLTTMLLREQMGTGLRQTWINLLKGIRDPGVRSWLVDDAEYTYFCQPHRSDAVHGTAPIINGDSQTKPGTVPVPPMDPSQASDHTTTAPVQVDIPAPPNGTADAVPFFTSAVPVGADVAVGHAPDAEAALLCTAVGPGDCRTTQKHMDPAIISVALAHGTLDRFGWTRVQLISATECLLVARYQDDVCGQLVESERLSVISAASSSTMVALSRMHRTITADIEDSEERESARQRRNREHQADALAAATNTIIRKKESAAAISAAESEQKLKEANTAEQLEIQKLRRAAAISAAQLATESAVAKAQDDLNLQKRKREQQELQEQRLEATKKLKHDGAQATQLLNQEAASRKAIQRWRKDGLCADTQRKLFLRHWPGLTCDDTLIPDDDDDAAVPTQRGVVAVTTTTTTPRTIHAAGQGTDTAMSTTGPPDDDDLEATRRTEMGRKLAVRARERVQLAVNRLSLPVDRITSFAIALEVCDPTASPMIGVGQWIDRLHAIIEGTMHLHPSFTRDRRSVDIPSLVAREPAQKMRAWVIPRAFIDPLRNELLGIPSVEMQPLGTTIHLLVPTDDEQGGTGVPRQPIGTTTTMVVPDSRALREANDARRRFTAMRPCMSIVGPKSLLLAMAWATLPDCR
jgi:hypothetical protein